MAKINVAIDGVSGAGKSTVGKLLAQHLGYHFLDSGLLYRHFAQFYQNHNFSLVSFDRSQLNQLLLAWQKLMEANPLEIVSQLEKERDRLTAPTVSERTSQLATLPELRRIILHFQQKLTEKKGWVVVGRDITSEVLPRAEIKIFLTASLEARVKRRYQQHSVSASLAQVEKELQKRDERDQNRPISPLVKTADSWELDTTHLSPHQSLQAILNYIQKTTNLN